MEANLPVDPVSIKSHSIPKLRPEKAGFYHIANFLLFRALCFLANVGAQRLPVADSSSSPNLIGYRNK